MESRREKRTFIIVLAISMSLMLMALITISASYAMPENMKSVNWNIFIDENVEKENPGGMVFVMKDKIDFHVSLKEQGSRYRFTTTVNNAGDFDAYLSAIEKTNLQEIKVGTGASGFVYTMNDYLNYEIEYVENSEKNEITAFQSLKNNDKLMRNSKMKIAVNINLKKNSSLTDDQIQVLNQYLETNGGIELDLNLRLLYQELK